MKPTAYRRTVLSVAAAMLVGIVGPGSMARAAGPAAGWQGLPGPADTRISDHTSTVLADGRILVVGSLGSGDYDESVIPTAEFFDPSDATWTKAPSPESAAGFQQSVLLGDGSVLLVGGLLNSGTLGAERFNPVTGTWVKTEPMVKPRVGHTLTVLLDGRVLAAGGLVRGDPAYEFTDSAEIFDPATNTWKATASMVQARSEHAAARLEDGRVLVVGGKHLKYDYDPSAGATLSDASIYDPATDIWSPVPTLMSTPRVGHTATSLPNGRVLITGGAAAVGHGGWANPPLASAEEFDPGSEAWVPVPPMAIARFVHSATTLPDGRVLVVGGNGEEGLGRIVHAVVSAELYDSRARKWSTMPAPPTVLNSELNRAMRTWMFGGHHTASLITHAPCGDLCGKVMFVGGGGKDAQVFTPPSAEVDPGDNGVAPKGLVIGAMAMLLVGALGFYRFQRRRSRSRARMP